MRGQPHHNRSRFHFRDKREFVCSRQKSRVDATATRSRAKLHRFGTSRFNAGRSQLAGIVT